MDEERIFHIAHICPYHLSLAILAYEFGYDHDAMFFRLPANDARVNYIVLQRFAHLASPLFFFSISMDRFS